MFQYPNQTQEENHKIKESKEDKSGINHDHMQAWFDHNPFNSGAPVQQKSELEDEKLVQGKNINNDFTNKSNLNTDTSLENEADIQGKRAASGLNANPALSSQTNTIQRQNDPAKGEIGLHNGNENRRSDGEWTISGENAEGESIRPVSYGSDEAYNRSEGLINNLQNNASTHAFYEWVAHYLAYRPEGYKPNASDLQTLAINGYEFDRVEKGDLGFQFAIVRSKDPSKKNDIIAFRGTQPKELATIYTDTNPTAVGYQQFRINRGLISSLFTGNRMDVTGHSLGGSLAQIVASYYAAQIGNVYTYQAPGIDDSMVARFNANKNDDTEVHHHVAVGDMVDKAGEMNLPGTVYVHDFGIHWIKTQELLQRSAQHIQKIGGGIGGAISESHSISSNVSKGILEAGVPFIGSYLLTERIQKIQQDISDLNSHIDSVKTEAGELKDMVSQLAGGIGEAHLKFLFSSENFQADRQAAGIQDSFYTKSEEQGGAGKDIINESSVVTAHESYPFQDERGAAETARDIVGTGIDMVINPDLVFLAYKTVDAVVFALEAIKNAMIKLAEFLTQMATSAWEAIKSIPGLIQEQLAEIGRCLEYMNTIDFWMQFYR